MKVKPLLDSVERICLFVGYPRSGHSLVGALLDSHPQATVSHELDLLTRWAEGGQWPDLAESIVKNSQRCAFVGRTQSGYDYSLPGQGPVPNPLLLGDKKGGRTAHYLLNDPDLLHRFQEATPWPIHLIHVRRDPRDMVATMSVRHKISVERAVVSFWERAEAVEKLRSRWPTKRFHDLSLELLLNDPRSSLRELSRDLGLPYEAFPLEHILELLFKEPKRTRHRVEWGEQGPYLERLCSNHPVFREYLS